MKIFRVKNILSILLLFPLFAEAQVNPHDGQAHKHHHHDLHLVPMARWKFYGGVGATTYAGEVTGRQIFGSNSLIESIEPRLAFNAGVGYKLHDRMFVKAELGYFKLKAVENPATTAKRGETGRGYYFKANNIDFAVLGQLNILPYKYLVKKMDIVPYAVLGIGFTTSRPKVEVADGDWRSLNELSDGQVKNKVLPIIPMGFGIMYRINCLFDIGLEGTLRYTLSGSLDGDSPGGINTTNLSPEAQAYFDRKYNEGANVVLKENPKFNDLYTNIQIRVTYTMIGEKYRHLFKQRDINEAPGHQHHNGNYNHHIRMHE
jgi:hypothetical protein